MDARSIAETVSPENTSGRDPAGDPPLPLWRVGGWRPVLQGKAGVGRGRVASHVVGVEGQGRVRCWKQLATKA